ncbi:MAG: electron transport complex protein RnfB [Proteobacteria bacterium]|nr:electron transport complex protein RnfB [Pseudomonadota bacterium]
MMAASSGSLADLIDAALPQTQCGRCGFEGCRPYAESLARGESPINRCPPGGRPVIERLSALLAVPQLPLDTSCGIEQPPRVARVVEADCIGCAKCIDACPTDAIVGARKWMHTVVQADCSGCELCLPACPVDCIAMDPAPGLPAAPLDGPALEQRARHFRRLHEGRLQRLARNERRRREALQSRLDAAHTGGGGPA